jgi:putative Mg2+ transporter-C (MgtC) family protein
MRCDHRRSLAAAAHAAARTRGRSVPSAELAIFLKVVVAAGCGFVVGFEREYFAHREAGTRTFSLIALSSALVTALALHLFQLDSAARVVSNIVVGVGFLGGGAIIKGGADIVAGPAGESAQGGRIRGLTTAAAIWGVAAIGMAIGSGLFLLGGLTSLLILGVLSVDHLEAALRRRFGRR